MNPTVEDEVVDDVPANQNSNPNANANDTPVPWSEVCFYYPRREPKRRTFSSEL